jgi:ketosteroid isomerase-like protein
MKRVDRRHFLAATAIAPAIVGCGALAQGADTPNVALVKSLYAAFGKGDIATIVGAVTPDVDWEAVGRSSDFPTLGPRKGPAAVQEFFGLVGTNLTFSEFSPKEFYAVGDKVFVLGRYAMTVKKTGKSMASDWVHIFTITGGKVSIFREFLDTARAAEAYRSRGASAGSLLPHTPPAENRALDQQHA